MRYYSYVHTDVVAADSPYCGLIGRRKALCSDELIMGSVEIERVQGESNTYEVNILAK